MNLVVLSLFSIIYYVAIVYCNNETNRSSALGYGGMVTSDHYLATQAGIEILKQGGTAADAAVAVQMALNVVRPFMTGIGGGCFIMYYDSSSGEVYAIDGREEAPNKYNAQVFCEKENCTMANETIPMPNRAYGGLSIGVPGTLSAMALMHDSFGSLDWSTSFEPAINLSENGFEMYEEFYNDLARSSVLKYFNGSRDLYYIDGLPAANIGETFYNKDLANTFRLLSTSSKDAIEIFYQGEIAQDIVNTAQNAFYDVTNRTGLMEMEDISNYTAVFRKPAITYYGNEYKIVGMNMPSSASTMQYILNMIYSLDNDENLSDLTGYGLTNLDIADGDTIHYLISLFNIAFADRNKYMADSDFEDVPMPGLINATYNQQRAQDILQDKCIDTPIDSGTPPGTLLSESNEAQLVNEEHGTTHFIVVDKDNNIACVTTTIERVFGSSVTVPGRGFTLNNELTDFDSLGTIGNQTVNNGPEGGKRLRHTALDLFGHNFTSTIGGKCPRSSMTPTIVLDPDTNQPILALD